MNRLERLYAVAETVRRRSPATVSARELAERFDVSTRTMERDLLALREAGVPLYAETGRTGGYAMAGDGGRVVFTLSPQEVIGLLMAVTAAGSAPFVESARSAADRLVDGLPPETRVAVDQLRDRVRTSVPGAPTVDPRLRRTLEEAVRRRLVVRLSYRDADGADTRRDVEAVGFHGAGAEWYLIGWCRLRNDRRVFRLDRVERAALTRTTFVERDVDETLGWVPGEIAPLA